MSGAVSIATIEKYIRTACLDEELSALEKVSFPYLEICLFFVSVKYLLAVIDESSVWGIFLAL